MVKRRRMLDVGVLLSIDRFSFTMGWSVCVWYSNHTPPMVEDYFDHGIAGYVPGVA